MTKKARYSQIINEWDSIAFERYSDLANGNDRSYESILKPNLLQELSKCNRSKVLDIGCGVGVFTKELAQISNNVIAIDVSANSIDIAKRQCFLPNITYQVISFEQFE